MAIRSSLYWLDGTRKKCSESQMAERNRDRIRLLVQALVDKYNEDHNLLGVCSLSFRPPALYPTTSVEIVLLSYSCNNC
jgi:hypothetical protein